MRRSGFLALLIVCGLLLDVSGTASGDPAPEVFTQWENAQPQRAAEVKAFETFLQTAGVSGVFPVDQLLLNATSWQHCKLESPYSLPPRSLWPHIVPTIRFIRDHVIPLVGPLDIDSGYREPKLNRCAGGAPKSAHAGYYALDMVPVRAVSRSVLFASLCRMHRETGPRYNVGLGFYDGLRFHIDTMRFRRWGDNDHAGTSPCAHISGD